MSIEEYADWLSAQLDRAMALLRETQWSFCEHRDLPTDGLHWACPVCFGWDSSQDYRPALDEMLDEWNKQPKESYGPARTMGHAHDCELNAMLEEKR